MWPKRKIVTLAVLVVLFSSSLAFAALPLFQISFQPAGLPEYVQRPVLDRSQFRNGVNHRTRTRPVGDFNYQAWRRVQSSA